MSAFACEPTHPEMKKIAELERQMLNKWVVKLANSADEIVLGTVEDVVDTESGSEYSQIAVIKIERSIKGNYFNKIEALMLKKQADSNISNDDLVEEIPNCGALDPEKYSPEPYTGKLAKGIFYIKDGVLIRANEEPVFLPPLKPEEEARLIEGY